MQTTRRSKRTGPTIPRKISALRCHSRLSSFTETSRGAPTTTAERPVPLSQTGGDILVPSPLSLAVGIRFAKQKWQSRRSDAKRPHSGTKARPQQWPQRHATATLFLSFRFRGNNRWWPTETFAHQAEQALQKKTSVLNIDVFGAASAQVLRRRFVLANPPCVRGGVAGRIEAGLNLAPGSRHIGPPVELIEGVA